ncbi:beta-3-deoxy-D-manno-oct-2-ulosonic acid transferase [Maritimibacter sp. 55A14]|uniref:capsular polysaccharide biosynthesis protein n=1 Tax=Maritimibacter sp. 55A14 TaxID=2174844 RepID=UPI000D61A53D|nr:capsular polysaccharide biosynthesis protein [Maritimibacter sp. 55A14]PWE33287.1 beta-3-deoxy-D-manno-oct-2-ulosonic acid transferase [Maritimibacter sp. 55A14]
MTAPGPDEPAAGTVLPRRLFVYSGGFLTGRRIRRILTLAGHELRLGLPGPGDGVAVWGAGPTSRRGAWVAAQRGVPLVRVEDAFLRSVLPGRAGGLPIGLMLDGRGLHCDASAASDLEKMLVHAPLDDPALLARAEAGIARMRAAHLSKYCACDPALDPPDPGYVLVVDQTRGDASIRLGGADAETFAQMLEAARAEHPDAGIVIKTHPETARGLRPGHFGPADADARTTLVAAPLSPWRLLDGAAAVYTVSSQLGFEAILAGHRPQVFGQPFYAGWGLSADRRPVARRGRKLTPAQLFAAAMLEMPVWYDLHADAPGSFETACDTLEAEARAWREDRAGYVGLGIRLWKRGHMQRVFGGFGPGLRHARDADQALALAARTGRRLMVWAGKEPPGLAARAAQAGVPLLRVEDGFLRSRGLGAELVPPLSLVSDDLGIYYDPACESRLERLIAASDALPQPARARAEALIARLRAGGASKYNTGAHDLPDLPRDRKVVLVPGQVEDDASILCGAGETRSNLGLLNAVRAARPDALILYKPHPDVEAGLRAGAVDEADALALADLVLRGTAPAPLLAVADEVWTMTSLLGFEALLRGVPVHCLGAPFYAGWGLTEDHGPVPERRRARPCLTGLTHAALIGYPRYFDPLTGRACPVEVVLDRLETGGFTTGGPGNRTLSKIQGLLASQAHLWRRR